MTIPSAGAQISTSLLPKGSVTLPNTVSAFTGLLSGTTARTTPLCGARTQTLDRINAGWRVALPSRSCPVRTYSGQPR